MRGRILMTLAAGTGLWLSGSQAADTAKTAKNTQPAATVTNQAVADEVAARIKASGAAEGAGISIKVEKGVVTLAGTCRTAAQQQEIAKHCMGVQGVREVVLGMKVVTGIEQASMQTPEPGALALQPPAPPAVQPMPMGMTAAGPGGYMPQDPVPLGAPGGAGYDPYGPKLPANAWPTYAPYPNMSRVAYPQAYPYNAFPYIGPYYPFPKVPMGWRTVQLSWEDGHWYMGKVSTPHDYWRVRFW